MVEHPFDDFKYGHGGGSLANTPAINGEVAMTMVAGDASPAPVPAPPMPTGVVEPTAGVVGSTDGWDEQEFRFGHGMERIGGASIAMTRAIDGSVAHRVIY